MDTGADLSSSVNHDPIGLITTSENSTIDMGSNIENGSSSSEIANRSKTLNPIGLSSMNKVSPGEIKTEVNTNAGKITRSRIPVLSYMPSIPARSWTTLSSKDLSTGKGRTKIPVLAKKPVFPFVNIVRTPINPGNSHKTFAFEDPCLNRGKSLTSLIYSRQEFPREKPNLCRVRSLTIHSYSQQEFPREKPNLKRSVTILSYFGQEFLREKPNLKRSLTILSYSRQEYPREKPLNKVRSLSSLGYYAQTFALEQQISNRRRCLKPGISAINFVQEESNINRVESRIPRDLPQLFALKEPSTSIIRSCIKRINSPKKMVREESKLNTKAVNRVGIYSIKFVREESNENRIVPPKLSDSTDMFALEKPSTSRLRSYNKRINSPKKMVREESKLNTKAVNRVSTSSVKIDREVSNVSRKLPPKLNNSTEMFAPEKPSTSRLRSYNMRINSPKKMVREESKLNTKAVNRVGTSSVKIDREVSNISRIVPPKLNNSTEMFAPEKPSTSRLRSYNKRINSPKNMVREESKLNTKPINRVNDFPPKMFQEQSNIKRMTPRTRPSDYALMFAPEEPTIKRPPRTSSNSQKSALVEPMLNRVKSPEKRNKYPEMFAPEETSYNRISARIRPRPSETLQNSSHEESKHILANPVNKQSNKVVQEECNMNEVKSPIPGDSAQKSALEEPNLNTIKSSNNSNSLQKTNEAEDPQPERKECRSCHRFFLPERLRIHEKICKKLKAKKRRVFDPVKHRVQGTDAEPYLRPPLKQPTPKPVRRLNWRKQHQEFILTIRAAKEAQAYVAKGGKLSDLPPPPPSDTSHYIPCPHCGRKFNDSAAARHIPKCAEMKHNKTKMAKPSKLQTKVSPRNKKTTQ